MTANRRTQHFNPEVDRKMHCTCCGEGQMSVGILIFLEHIRQRYNAPVTIHSGPRCKTYNAKVGGSKRSEHLIVAGEDNDVVDLSVEGVTTKDLHMYVKGLPYANLMAIGYYPQERFVHVDLRGHAARW